MGHCQQAVYPEIPGRALNLEGNPVNDFLSGGIRPLNLTEAEIDALVAFMEALTSPKFTQAGKN